MISGDKSFVRWSVDGNKGSKVPKSIKKSNFNVSQSLFIALPSPSNASSSPFNASPSSFNASPSLFTVSPSPFIAFPSPFNASPSPFRAAHHPRIYVDLRDIRPYMALTRNVTEASSPHMLRIMSCHANENRTN